MFVILCVCVCVCVCMKCFMHVCKSGTKSRTKFVLTACRAVPHGTALYFRRCTTSMGMYSTMPGEVVAIPACHRMQVSGQTQTVVQLASGTTVVR